MGAALNVSMKSGTNRYRGSATWAYTPKTWVSDNTPGAATSQTMTVNQPEAALGGPLQRNRWWFYASYRRRLGSLGLSRPANQIADMKALVSGFEPFDNGIDGHNRLREDHRTDPAHPAAVWLLQSRRHVD